MIKSGTSSFAWNETLISRDFEDAVDLQRGMTREELDEMLRKRASRLAEIQRLDRKHGKVAAVCMVGVFAYAVVTGFGSSDQSLLSIWVTLIALLLVSSITAVSTIKATRARADAERALRTIRLAIQIKTRKGELICALW